MEASLSSLMNAQIFWLAFLILMLTLTFTLGGLKFRLEHIKEARVNQLRELGASLNLNVERAVEEIENDGAP